MPYLDLNGLSYFKEKLIDQTLSVAGKAADAQAFGEALDNRYPTDTASGAIASFPDGADDVPVEALSVALEPIQDLNGQSSPYPAGGGVNKIVPKDITTTINDVSVVASSTSETIKLSGTASGNGGRTRRLTELFTLQAGTYYFASWGNTDGVALNNSADALIKWANSSSFTLESATDVYVGASVIGGTTYNDTIKVALVSGSTAPTAWTPYSNICPITGHTQAQVWRSGVNVWDEEWENGSINFSTGAKQSSSANIRSKNYISVVGGETYYGKAGTLSSSACVVFFYTEDKTYISNAYCGNTTFTAPSNAKYALFYCGSAYGTTYNNDISINYPSTDHDYHAHSIANISIPLGQTVYGGSLDVVGGKCVVDRAYETITKDSAWYGFATGTGNSSAVVQLAEYQNVLYVDGSSSHNGAISSTGSEEANYWVNARQNEMPTAGDMCFAYSATGQLRFHRLDVATITDIASFKANFPDTQVCYKLATPITIDLTDIPELTTLLGQNNIFSDAGDVDVTYRADVKLYIQKYIASMVSAQGGE